MNALFGFAKHCDQPAAFVLSRNRWKCHTHLLRIENVNLNIQTNSTFPSNPALYKCLTDNPRAKKVHSIRLGVKYEVVVKRYRPYKGNNNQNLKEIMEPTITLSKKDAHLEIINDNDIFFHRRTPPPDEIDDDKGRLQRPLMRNKRKKVEIPPSPGQDL
ncbi:unnamed protein product [Rhizophagus irregularis]|uniref:Uncharacterized protein n=1 Tax=Rhizophagus irregularis TaxID=588596 RepID=A0A915YW24_9GLOM|nr:unnamed protein product [Rhizophagus irregularis]